MSLVSLLGCRQQLHGITGVTPKPWAVVSGVTGVTPKPQAAVYGVTGVTPGLRVAGVEAWLWPGFLAH
jgi:hypothetical protein